MRAWSRLGRPAAFFVENSAASPGKKSAAVARQTHICASRDGRANGSGRSIFGQKRVEIRRFKVTISKKPWIGPIGPGG